MRPSQVKGSFRAFYMLVIIIGVNITLKIIAYIFLTAAGILNRERSNQMFYLQYIVPVYY